MGTCRYCNESSKTISDVIGYCAGCIRDHFKEVWPKIKKSTKLELLRTWLASPRYQAWRYDADPGPAYQWETCEVEPLP